MKACTVVLSELCLEAHCLPQVQWLFLNKVVYKITSVLMFCLRCTNP